MFIVLNSCLQLYSIIVIKSYIKWRENVWNQHVCMTKRAKFATLAISVIENLCLLQQHKWNTIKIILPLLIINELYGSNFMTILEFFISPEKTGCF